MKNFLPIIIMSVWFTSMFSCKSSKLPFDPEISSQAYLCFGSGGGFTGKINRYYLVKDGNLYSNEGDSFLHLGMVKKQAVTQIFNNFTSLGIDKMSINNPGNRYYFIESSLNQAKTNITWGKEELKDKNIETFYAILMSLVKNLNVKNLK